jgi:hypothetical protein
MALLTIKQEKKNGSSNNIYATSVYQNFISTNYSTKKPFATCNSPTGPFEITTSSNSKMPLLIKTTVNLNTI